MITILLHSNVNDYVQLVVNIIVLTECVNGRRFCLIENIPTFEDDKPTRLENTMKTKMWKVKLSQT